MSASLSLLGEEKKGLGQYHGNRGKEGGVQKVLAVHDRVLVQWRQTIAMNGWTKATVTGANTAKWIMAWRLMDFIVSLRLVLLSSDTSNVGAQRQKSCDRCYSSTAIKVFQALIRA